MTREEIISKYSVSSEFIKRGHKLISTGPKKFKCKCPFHPDQTPSLAIEDDKHLWQCFGCKASGSVIDAVMRFDKLSAKDAMEKLGNSMFEKPKPTHVDESKLVNTYLYTDANGKVLYEVCRFEPKDFRQRHKDEHGNWVWNMDGVSRVLYKLPEVLKAKQVIIVEGEKDVNTLVSLGFTATCNVGGAGKWLDPYTDALADKDIVLCGDNDKPGQEHIEKVFESISGKVKTTRTIKIPQPFKDVSDFIASFKCDFTKAKEAITELINSAQVLHRGLDIPIFSMYEMEADYMQYVKESSKKSLSFASWIPSLSLRPIVPGEMVTFIADTGVGKTALLQNLAIRCRNLSTILFEMELPTTLLFERFICATGTHKAKEVENQYLDGQQYGIGIQKFLDHIYCCPKSGLTVPDIENICRKAELKTGHKPELVLIDYIQLMQAKGNSRYERMSNVAESLKVLAKELKVIMVITSQVSRKGADESNEVFLHDAKDSGGIENSSGLVIGCWRDTTDVKLLKLKVCKSTKGGSGQVINCNFDGETMLITERANYRE